MIVVGNIPAQDGIPSSKAFVLLSQPVTRYRFTHRPDAHCGARLDPARNHAMIRLPRRGWSARDDPYCRFDVVVLTLATSAHRSADGATYTLS
jgi:hypothetical protein